MSAYFASRIEKGKLDYASVINKYPQYKSKIDEILVADGFEHLIEN